MSKSADAFNQFLAGEGFGGDFEISNEIVKSAMEQDQQERSKRAVEALKDIVTAGRTHLQTAVIALRTARAAEKKAKEKVDTLNDAVEFLKKTGNPFPLYKAQGYHENSTVVTAFCSRIGQPVPDKDDPIWTVDKE